MTLQALRERIGDPTVFRLMKTWYADHKYGNVTTAQFVSLAEQLSGRDLSGFFDAWLYTDGKPAPQYL
jgi:aminopeptidase N